MYVWEFIFSGMVLHHVTLDRRLEDGRHTGLSLSDHINLLSPSSTDFGMTAEDLTIAKNVVAWITANQTNLSTPSPSDVKAGEIFLFEKSSQEPGSRWVDRRSWEQVSRRQFQNMGCEISEEKRASDSLLTGPLLRKINWRNVKIDSKTYQLVVYEEAKPPDRRGEKFEQSDLPKDIQEKYPEEDESHDRHGDEEIRSRSSHFFEVILNK